MIAFIKPGFWEILLIVLAILLIFGPKRLPQIGSAIGEAIKGLKKSLKGDDNDNQPKT